MKQKSQTVHHPFKLTRFQLITAAVLSAVVFFVSAYFAFSGQLFFWEIELFQLIYRLPDWLTPTMYAITLLGSSFMFLGIVAAAWLLRYKTLALTLFINGGITFVIIQAAKLIVGRDRPALLLTDIQVRDPITSGYGFPSGHTAITLIVALTLLSFVPRRYWWIILLWAPLVAASRLFLGVHVPLDIVGGAAVATFVYCVYRLEVGTILKLNKKAIKL